MGSITFIQEKNSVYVADFQKISYYPSCFKYGRGALLYDYNGKEYIDFLSSASSANVGHGNENAVFTQMKKIAQYTSLYFPMPEGEALAKKLINLLRYKNMQVAYSNSGSAAIDCAIKLARAYTKRNKIISFKGAYHGSTYGASSISAISPNMKKNIGVLVPEIYHIIYPYCFRCNYCKKDNNCNKYYCLKELTEALEQYIPPSEVAAVFIEPIAGDMGIVVPPTEYLQKLQELCNKHNILLVVDEIQQAMCRTGKWFSFEHFGIRPDIIVLGKTVGAGLPLGVTIARREIMNSLSAPAHVFTMSGNSTVCAAAIKQLEIFEREKMNVKVKEKGLYLKEKLQLLMSKYDIVGEIRGIGLSLGVEIVSNKKDKTKNKLAAAKISYNCIENGLLLTFLGENVLRIQPPLVITEEQIDKAVKIMDNSFEGYLNGEISDEVLKYAKGW